MKYSVGIIGLGQIGMTYDSDFVGTDDYLSHAKSFHHHPNFRIEFLMDVLPAARKRATEIFPGIQILESTTGLKSYPDVLVLAANQITNINIYNQLRNEPSIKLFVVEKPFWDDSFVDIPFDMIANERVYVNYIRKSLPFYQELQEQIRNGFAGKAINVNVVYSKGLRNNGSHLLDLINFLFEPTKINVLSVFDTKNDFKEEDLSYSFVLELETIKGKFPVVFNAINEQNYSVIELDLFFEKKRFRCTDFGGKVQEYNLEMDPLFPGYVNLAPAANFISTELNKYAIYSCHLIYEILSERAENPSSIQNEKAIFELVKKIKNFE